MIDGSATGTPGATASSGLQEDPRLAFPATRAAPSGEGWDALLVVIVAWTAHFSLFRRFGLYEDDYWLVAEQGLAWGWIDAQNWVKFCVFTLHQGRPIGMLLGSLVPFLWFRLGVGALPLVYLAASVIVSVNAVLAHRLLARSYGRSFALFGALAFTLYPADTTQSYLTHAFAIQSGLTIVLLALLAYVSGRRVIAYALAACALLTYESTSLAFVAAPLLSPTWDRRLFARWARHVAIVGALVVGVLWLRSVAGEARVSEVRWTEIPIRAVQAMWIGPRVSLLSYAARSATAIGQLGRHQLALMAAGAFVALLAAFLRHTRGAWLDRAVLVRAGLTGMAMLVGGYAFEFAPNHFPPTMTQGRFTGAHTGATLGASIVCATVLAIIWTAGRHRAARIAIAAATAALFASLWTYRFTVQEGLVRSAEHQRVYWSRLVELLPDLSAKSLVILIGEEPAASEFILTSSGMDTKILPLLFREPSGRAPILVGGTYVPFTACMLEARDGRLWWTPKTPIWWKVDRKAPLPQDGVIVLEHDDAGWHRRVGSITFHGVTVPLPPPPPGAKIALEKGPLYPLLLGSASRTTP